MMSMAGLLKLRCAFVRRLYVKGFIDRKALAGGYPQYRASAPMLLLFMTWSCSSLQHNANNAHVPVSSGDVEKIASSHK